MAQASRGFVTTVDGREGRFNERREEADCQHSLREAATPDRDEFYVSVYMDWITSCIPLF